MLLTADRAAHYLLDRGLIDRAAAVDGDLLIVDASSRNRNFKVVSRRGPSCFVKQVQQPDPQSIAFLQREASCAWLAANDPQYAALAPLIPAFRHYDQARHILVLELLPDGESMGEHHRRLGRFPLEPAARLGKALAAYHAGVRPEEGQGSAALFPRAMPWILSAHRMAGSSLNSSPANQQLVQIIARYGDFHTHLDALRARWRYDAFIHGDMKWENVLVYPHNGDVADLEIKIVDWETADVGDAAWDVGAIIQAYLTFWILSLPIAPGASPAQFLGNAMYPIEGMQPAVRAFWLAYVQAAAVPVAAQRELLARSTGYAAARMLQTAYEYMHQAPQVTSNALALLQVSLNILPDPAGAAAELLNL